MSQPIEQHRQQLASWQRTFDAIDREPKRHPEIGDRVRVHGGRWDAMRGIVTDLIAWDSNPVSYLINPENLAVDPEWIPARFVLPETPPQITCSPGDTHYVNQAGTCQCGIITGVTIHHQTQPTIEA